MFLFGKKKQQQATEYQNILSALRSDTRSVARKTAAEIQQSIGLLTEKVNRESKSINLQLEDLCAVMNDSVEQWNENGTVQELKQVYEDKICTINGQNKAAVKALLQMADLIEDFHVYSRQQEDPDIRTQAGLMWGNACKALANAGLAKISDEGTTFDPRLNQIQGTVCDEQHANGVVIEVLRSGYIYCNEVVRKSAVVVNSREQGTV